MKRFRNVTLNLITEVKSFKELVIGDFIFHQRFELQTNVVSPVTFGIITDIAKDIKEPSNEFKGIMIDLEPFRSSVFIDSIEYQSMQRDFTIYISKKYLLTNSAKIYNFGLTTHPKLFQTYTFIDTTKINL